MLGVFAVIEASLLHGASHIERGAPSLLDFSFVHLPVWVYWALGILGSLSVTTLLAVLYLQYTRRKADLNERFKDKKDAVEATALRDIWNRFLSELPRSARAAVPNYPSFLLLGPASAGKSHLVRARIDCQEHTGQLVPSYTADPMLQIYIGSRALALELSATMFAGSCRTVPGSPMSQRNVNTLKNWSSAKNTSSSKRKSPDSMRLVCL